MRDGVVRLAGLCSIRIMDFGIRFAVVSVLLLASVGCVQVPGTDRYRAAIVSDAAAMQMGLSEFEKMKAQAPIRKDRRLSEMVNRVGTRIAGVVADDMPNAQWEFVVFENDQPNAFALPRAP